MLFINKFIKIIFISLILVILFISIYFSLGSKGIVCKEFEEPKKFDIPLASHMDSTAEQWCIESGYQMGFIRGKVFTDQMNMSQYDLKLQDWKTGSMPEKISLVRCCR